MPITTRTRAVGASFGVALLLTSGLLWAQEPASSSLSRASAPSAKRTSDPSRRVPVYFGQIGLTPEQRESIYQIRGKHQARIAELEKQVAEIQTLMLVECEGVLTDTQKQLLTQRRKASAVGVQSGGTEKSRKGQNTSGD